MLRSKYISNFMILVSKVKQIGILCRNIKFLGGLR